MMAIDYEAFACFIIELSICSIVIMQRHTRNVDFIVSALLSGMFFSCHLFPYFDPHMKGFVALATLVVFIGAMVGGVVGILLPKIASGICTGVFVALIFSSFLYSANETALVLPMISTIFVIAISLGIMLAQKYEKLCSSIKTSFAASLLLVLAGDTACGQFGVSLGLSEVLRLHPFRHHPPPSPPDNELSYRNWILFAWLLLALLIFLLDSYLSGEMTRWSLYFSARGYSRVPIDDSSGDLKPASRRPAPQRTFSYPDSLEFNYFDPDNLPRAVQGYADYIFSSVQALSAEIGFQVDNSRNQAEHLLMLLTNECRRGEQVTPSVPPTRLHDKMFCNYRKWCKALGTTPSFTPAEAGRAHMARIEDMLVFLLVWGEAANLRHMPECLCYLYHRTMKDHLSLIARRQYASNNINFYPGYFLDMVVTPIYDVVSTSMKVSGDHIIRKTYDDFNEFFWSPVCLKYAHHHSDDLGDVDGSHTTDTEVTISEALQNASKTYLEKRSWLHPLQSFHRIMEWHVIAFTILATIAFSNALVWRVSYTLLVGSFIFWEINFMGILSTCLEVWTIFPSSSLSGPAIYGYLLRLLAGYVVLLYQSIYFHWAFRHDDAGENSMRSLGDANFWWWQYLWISFFALLLYFAETIICCAPAIYSYVMVWNNDFVQALLNILYPFSQLYVGKAIHTKQLESLTYICFWLTLIAFKLWFGYYYIVFPITVPSIELYDDYMNYPEVPFVKTAVLMAIWWFPHFMVFLIDLSIWFSVWSATVGGLQALLDRQGAVRNAHNMRSHFMKLPFAFAEKLMPADTSSQFARAVSRMSTAALPTKGQLESITPAQSSSTQPSRARSTNELHSYQYSSIPDNEFDSVEVAPQMLNYSRPHQQIVEEFLDSRSKKWVNFACVWNEIIMKLREGDLLSNSEREILIFTHFDWLSKPVYLPLYQTAGRVETAIYEYKNAAASYHHKDSDPAKKILIAQNLKRSLDVPTAEAVTEVWELMRWVLLALMGPAHNEDMQQVFSEIHHWAVTDDVYKHMSLNKLPAIVDHLYNIANSLKGVLTKRSKSPVISGEVAKQSSEAKQTQESVSTSNSDENKGGITRSISTGFLAAIGAANGDPDSLPSTSNEGESGTRPARSSRKSDTKYTQLQPFRSEIGVADRVRDKIRDDLRGVFNLLKDALRRGGSGQESAIAPQAHDIINRITFILSLEKGFLWNDVYASRQVDDLAKDIRMQSVLSKVCGLLKLRQTQIEPASPEARRRLHFFVNSLFMNLPSVPSMIHSKDYTCLTPFYSEDVLLTRDDLEQKNSDGVSTILYLQTLYKKDWHNFLERLGLVDDQLIWSSKNIQETRMWASMRAQTLFRTVEGMMFTETSIRLLGELEGIADQTLDALAKLKFSYVVAAQAYATMKKTGDHKADDIDFLLARHPNLRVAYIETLRPHRSEHVTYYSVLIKHDSDATSDSTHSRGKAHSEYKVKEVYRVKLPGNPILGEGKPENQNHAVVFTRGRYLQAIDMNQAGYFEESLKMRNLLQEFDLTGCKILGFREHIFTGSVSSVANYMALQELSFVTLGQRVLTQPLCVRQHYGHPDIFDKLFVMTEGGVSKASRGINLSEDVFAGFNCTIRGHRVEFREYAQVGKGRDVGLQQTYKFEAKLSQGNAEQSISRDMSRLCSRLDFFRLMSFYYGGIGHYMANTIVMFTLVLVVYTMVATAIFNEEAVNGRKLKPEGVLQMVLAGMGLLQTLPLCSTLAVEKGFVEMVSEIVYMIISGGPLYFIFHIQTKSFYFQQTLLAGGAMYRPTGRGFVTRHSSFDENFRFFASSHIYLGVEIMMALIFYGMYTTSKQYLGLTWSLWLVVLAFLLGPFWFNPLSFESPKVLEDYAAWMQWMDESGGRSEQSWSTWWKEENAYIRDLSGSWKIFLVVSKCAMWSIVGVGLLGSKFVHSYTEQYRMGRILVIFILYFVCKWLLHKYEMNCGYAARRLLHYAVNIGAAIPLVYLFFKHTRYFRYAIALYYIISATSYVLLLNGLNSIVIHLYKVHDLLVGHMLFAVLLMMSIFQIGILQTWLLYHNALSSGVVIEDILKYARKTKERADAEGESTLADLRTQLANQEKTIKLLLEANPSLRTETQTLRVNTKLANNAAEATPLNRLSPRDLVSPPDKIPSVLSSNTTSKKNYGSVSFKDSTEDSVRRSGNAYTSSGSNSPPRGYASMSSISRDRQRSGDKNDTSTPRKSRSHLSMQTGEAEFEDLSRKPAGKNAEGFFFKQPSALPKRE